MILITGGGTGGHLAIAKALKESLISLDQQVVFVGSTRGQDMAWFEADQQFEKCYFLPSSGVMNKGVFGKFLSLFAILKLAIVCRKIFATHDIKAVISVGGYSAAPASIASVLFKIPLFIHEQNAVLGSLNHLLKPFAKEFFSSFDKSSKCQNYPVNSLFFEKKRIRSEIKTTIFLGGSQGAAAINEYAMQVAPLLDQKGIKIIHQSGKNDYAKLKEFYSSLDIEADLFEFDPDIVLKISKADLAVARSGAGTLFELMANGLPALFVPYPHAAGDHQMANAKMLADQKLAWVSDQASLSPDQLIALLDHNLSEISQNLTKNIALDGAECIAKRVLA